MNTRIIVIGKDSHSVLANYVITTLEDSPDIVFFYLNEGCTTKGMNFDNIIVDECVELGLLCPWSTDKQQGDTL